MSDGLNDIVNGVDNNATDLNIYVRKSNEHIGEYKAAGMIGKGIGKGETRFSRRTAEAGRRADKERDYAHEIRMHINKVEGNGKYAISALDHDFTCVSVININYKSSETDDTWDEKLINENVDYHCSQVTIEFAQSCASKKKNGFIDFYHKNIEGKSRDDSTEPWPFQIFLEFNSHSASTSGLVNRIRNRSNSVLILKLDKIMDVALRREFLILKNDEEAKKERQDYWIFTLTGELSFVNSVEKPPKSLKDRLKSATSSVSTNAISSFGESPSLPSPGGLSPDINMKDDGFFELDEEENLVP